MKKLVSGFMLGAVLVSGSAAPALATEGHTPVSYCHNGAFITTDDDGATNGHKTRKGIHANDVFSEDVGGRAVEPSDCLGPVEVPRNPGPKHAVDYKVDLDCVANTKIFTSVATVTEYTLNVEENVWEALPPTVSSSQSVQEPTAEDCPVVIPPHGEPAPPVDEPVTPEPAEEAYPAPAVTPNTVNGTPTAEPTGPAGPSGVDMGPPAVSMDEPAQQQQQQEQLANTGFNWLLVWAAGGFLALGAGVISVVRLKK